MRVRRRPWPAAEDRSSDLDATPGRITPPPGVLPGWDWLPPGGLSTSDADLSWWVQVWRRVPFVDRYAHVWMWHHGGFRLPPPSPPRDGGDPAGDREPRRPSGSPPALARARAPRPEQLPHP